MNKFYSLLLLVASSQVFSQSSPPSLKDEKLVIFFHCDLMDGQGKETIEDILSLEKQKALRELGSVFYFHFPIKTKEEKEVITKGENPKENKEISTEDKEFFIRSGSFQVLENFAAQTAFFYFNKAPIFTLHFTEENYGNVKDKDSKIPSFIFLREKIPNQFRYFGNRSYLSCPEKSTDLGKLSLYLRDAAIIRKNLEYIQMSENKGDF
jgi:hypothetical protein